MRKIFGLGLVVICAAGCAATHRAWTERSINFSPEAQKKVAIYPLSGDMTGAVQDALTTELFGMGYEVVERSEVRAILNEMKLGSSGALSNAQTKEVGRATSADAIIFGSVRTTLAGAIHSLDLRFVDISSGEIIWSCNYFNKNVSSPRKSIIEISNSIQNRINKPIAVTKTNKFGDARLSLSQNPALPGKRYNKVALLPLGGTHAYGEDDAIYGALVTSLVGNGVQMVERKELNNIFQEQVKTESGLYANLSGNSLANGLTGAGVSKSTAAFFREFALTPKDMAEIGRITGADALLIGTFQPIIYNPFTIAIANLRLLDLETGKIAWSGSYYNGEVSIDNYILVTDWLSVAFAPLITTASKKDYDYKVQAVLANKKASEGSIIEKLFPGDNTNSYRK